MTDTWPACATYPNLGCVCRGALGQNKSTCTRKRTGDLEPIRTAGGPPMTEHNTSGGLTEGEREALRGLGQGQVPAVVERILADRLAVVQAERDEVAERLSALLCDLTGGLMSKTNYSVATMTQAIEAEFEKHATADAADLIARAESAEAENARLRAEVEALADEWEERAGERSEAWRVFGPQTVSVPFAVASLRAALDSPTSHTQREAEVGARVTIPAHHLVGMDLGFTCTNCGGHTSTTAPCIPARDVEWARADALAADTGSVAGE